MSHPLSQSGEMGMLTYLLALRWAALPGKAFSCAAMSRGVLTRPPQDVLFLGHVVTFWLALAVHSPASRDYFDGGMDKWKTVLNKH